MAPNFELASAAAPRFVIPLAYVWYYLLVINGVAFLWFGFDKLQAGTGGRRIRETTLWLLVALGGTPGALLAMKVFRHKTKKASFQLGVVTIVVLQIVLLTWYFGRG